MRILFICGSLEPGRDGVGDYSRKLAMTVVKQGHCMALVSINDNHVSHIERDSETCDNFSIQTLRIPANLSWKTKAASMHSFIEKFNPEWLSLQFVPYSYHKKGIPLIMILNFLNIFLNRKLQIMFHELWLGEKLDSTLKDTLIGFIQKKLTLFMLRNWKPILVQTSIPLYRKILSLNSVKAEVLPIFSNISNLNMSRESHLKEIPSWLASNRQNFLIGCNFGSFYEASWDLSTLLPAFSFECQRLNKTPLIISIGKMTSGREAWDELSVKYPSIKFLTIGSCSESLISYWMSHFTDFGIITTPAVITGKSGSFMAFRDHGLYCFCKSNDLQFNFEVEDIQLDQNLIPINSSKDFYIPHRAEVINQLALTTNIFLNSLKSSQ